jgi:hypothetical protein
MVTVAKAATGLLRTKLTMFLLEDDVFSIAFPPKKTNASAMALQLAQQHTSWL